MSVLSIPRPSFSPDPVYRITVRQYHDMIEQGILREGDPVELLEGVLVQKMNKHPPHILGTQVFIDLFPSMLPEGWFLNVQAPIAVTDSEPEPDIAVIRGKRRDYSEQARIPSAADVGLVIEVADASLAVDRGTKRRVYARAGVAQYWIVNLVDRRVEVYTRPSGATDSPAYAQQRDYQPGEEVPVVLDGDEVGRVRVGDLMI